MIQLTELYPVNRDRLASFVFSLSFCNSDSAMLKEKGDDINMIDILNYFTIDNKKLTILGDEFENDQNEALHSPRSTSAEKMGDKGIGTILDYLSKDDNVENALRNKLEDVFEDLEGLPKTTTTWGEFLTTKKNIVIISAGSDGLAKDSHLTDMLLASLYSYKQFNPDKRITVIIDECQNLYLDTNGPIDIMLRKGGKHGIRMLLASQEFSFLKDKLGKIIGNCGTLVFFRPKVDNLADIAKLTGVDKAILADLEQGQCVVYGFIFEKSKGKNKQFTLIGFTYKHDTK